MSKLLGVVGIIALVVALIIAGPLLLIWALNTLFPALAIGYTVWTWLAALILAATVSPTVKVKR
jgi:hypothetical protein